MEWHLQALKEITAHLEFIPEKNCISKMKVKIQIKPLVNSFQLTYFHYYTIYTEC